MTLEEHKYIGAFLKSTYKNLDKLYDVVANNYGIESEGCKYIKQIAAIMPIARVGFDDLLWEEHRNSNEVDSLCNIYYGNVEQE